jgi:hypothetical protein
MSFCVTCTSAFTFAATRPDDEQPTSPTAAAANAIAVTAPRNALAPIVLIVSGTPQRAMWDRTEMIAATPR